MPNSWDEWLFAFFSFGAAGIGMFCICMLCISKHEITNCYLDISSNGQNILMQNVAWKEDAKAGIFSSPEEAVKFAEKINCPIMVKQ